MSSAREPGEIAFDDWQVLPNSGGLRRQGIEVRLQEQPLTILDELLRNPGKLVTREQLVARLWPKGVVDFDTGLNTAVRKLRLALGDDADAPKYIETLPRKGYRFIGQIRTPEATEQSTASTTPMPSPEVSRQPRISRRWLLLGAVLLVAIAFATYRAIPESRGPQEQSSRASAAIRIAVLPFQNLSTDPDNAFFADGLHEEVLTELTNSVPGLEVISRTTMMTYRGVPKPVATIARELGATYLLQGSVRREGSQVRLTLQLIDAATDAHVWAHSYDRRLDVAMTLQAEVAREVASQLSLQLVAARRAPVTTRDPEAYDLYLKARLGYEVLNGGSQAEAKVQVHDLYSQAIARDPDFAAAYIGRVLHVTRLAALPIPVHEPWREETRSDLLALERLLGDDPRVHALKGIVAGYQDGDWSAMLEDFALDESRGLRDPDILVLKTGPLISAGRMDEALALTERLLALDPGNVGLLLAQSASLWLARKPVEALRAADLMIERWPGDGAAYWREYRVGLVYNFSGRSAAEPDLNNTPPGMDPGLYQTLRIEQLRLQGDYAGALAIIGKIESPYLPRNPLFQSTELGLPPAPVAEASGWIHLLQGNGPAARADGAKMLGLGKTDFRYRIDLDWMYTLRNAEARLFTQDNGQAVKLARQALEQMPRKRDAVLWAYTATVAARVLAWGGEQEQAAMLLDELDAARPGVSPTTLSRDPLYTMPLAKTARYQALRSRLEAQMAAIRLE